MCDGEEKVLDCGENKIIHIMKETSYGNLDSISCLAKDVTLTTGSTNTYGSTPIPSAAAANIATTEGAQYTTSNNEEATSSVFTTTGAGEATVTNLAIITSPKPTAGNADGEKSNDTKCYCTNCTQKVGQM